MSFIKPNTNAYQLLAIIFHRRGDGFILDSDLPELAKIDRLFPCLVRCGGCRFTCAVQDVSHLVGIITKEGSDYVRDISMLMNPPPPKPGPYGSWEKREVWKPTPANIQALMDENGPTGHGDICHSDADPGL